MFKLLTITVLSVLFAGSVCAQSFDGWVPQPSEPVRTVPAGRVTVTEYGDAAQAVRNAAQSVSRQRLRGYRVCVFFDNGQGARAGAVAAKSLFESTFSGIPVYMVYENPYFKVTVGNCLTAEEAIILKGKVSGTFPKAFLKNEDLALTDFIR